MSRKPDPENVYLARRRAILSILTAHGMPPDKAEERVEIAGAGDIPSPPASHPRCLVMTMKPARLRRLR